jgi:hypothetical protein
MRLGRSHPLGTAADYVLNPKHCCRVEFKREPIERSDGTRREICIPATFGALSDVIVEPAPVLQRDSFNDGPMKQKAALSWFSGASAPPPREACSIERPR